MTLRRALLISLFVPTVCGEPQWQAGTGYRFHEVTPAGEKGAGFQRVRPPAIQFNNHLSERLVAANRVTENGSGVALGDVDGDGLCDVYFSGLERSNALYRNLGNWQFEDITASAGVACPNQLSTGTVLADVDGDADLDLLVNSIGGGTRLFLNDGRARFTEQTQNRLVKRFGSMSAALGDVDRDGDLDLYIANYRTIVYKDELPPVRISAQMVNGKIQVTPANRFVALGAKGTSAEVMELAERDFFYINTGAGNFAPASWTNGNFLDERGQRLMEAPLDWALGAMIRDFTQDGLPDIFVCNDFYASPDRAWFQLAGTKFAAAPVEAFKKWSLASMAVDVADINRDGHDDIFVVEMLSRDFGYRQNHRDNAMKAEWNTLLKASLLRPEVPRNTLFLNRGNGTYAEIAEYAGLDASEWSWGAVFLDVDLDGYEDVIVPTGHNHDVQEADALREISRNKKPDSIPARVENLARFGRLETPILSFRNGGDLRFEETDWGLGIPGIANGVALGDLDNDGDLDLVGNRLNGEALFMRNEGTGKRLGVRLRGLGENRYGIGAKITVTSGTLPQRQEMLCGGRYLSSDDTLRVFAAPNEPLSCRIEWPNGVVTSYADLKANRVYEFAQPSGGTSAPRPEATEPFFRDATIALNHRHADSAFDDFKRQPLLPYSLSSQGPGLAWYDINADGREDLLVSAGRGGRLGVRINEGDGRFSNVTNAWNRASALEPQLGLLLAKAGSNQPTLFIANSNYEVGGRHVPSVSIGGGALEIPGAIDSAQALALGDIDADGDLDLLIGGRVLPGLYPLPASSRIYQQTEGKFVRDEMNSKTLEKAGLVTSAIFTDLTQDGRPELVLAREWGSIEILLNEGGKFRPANFGLDKMRGWWNSVASGDFDNDGRMDLVAGNWGLNNKYARWMQKPLRMYGGDLDGNGTSDVIEALYNPAAKRYVPWAGLELLARELPQVGEQFGMYSQFVNADVEDVLGRPRAPLLLEIDRLESVCLLNRGDRFEVKPFPAEAQFAPIFGLGVADFDLDGNLDVVAAQNLEDTRWDTGPLDSGVGVWLRGDGTGSFRAVPVASSGIEAHGQQRAVAVADYNNDGRPDVAISQNGSETKLFENRGGPKGIRLRFQGPRGNEDAIGAVYTLRAGERIRASGELQAGSGWISQQSHVRIVPRIAGGRLEVRWPGGQVRQYDVPEADELLLGHDGSMKILQ